MVDFLDSLFILYVVESVVVFLAFFWNSSEVIAVFCVKPISPVEGFKAFAPLIRIDK